MEPLEPGTRFGNYVIEGYVAGGGMGEVYAARDAVYGTPVAIKVLHEALHADPDWRRRFNEEGLVGTQLKHPHVLAARELVEVDGRVGLVMDLVRGAQTLHKLIVRDFATGLTMVHALQLFLGIVQGVEYLHGKGIIHGDIKPENVLVATAEHRRPETWVPLVTDFGTVGLLAHPVMIDGQAAVVASPRYCSPEHLLGMDRLERRSDVYSLGLVLHFLLTGRHASDARTVEEAVDRVNHPITLSAMVDVPEAVIALVRKATAPSAADRHATARELALAVRRVLDELGIKLAVEDLQADLATEVMEEREKMRREQEARAAAEAAAEVAAVAPPEAEPEAPPAPPAEPPPLADTPTLVPDVPPGPPPSEVPTAPPTPPPVPRVEPAKIQLDLPQPGVPIGVVVAIGVGLVFIAIVLAMTWGG